MLVSSPLSFLPALGFPVFETGPVLSLQYILAESNKDTEKIWKPTEESDLSPVLDFKILCNLKNKGPCWNVHSGVSSGTGIVSEASGGTGFVCSLGQDKHSRCIPCLQHLGSSSSWFTSSPFQKSSDHKGHWWHFLGQFSILFRFGLCLWHPYILSQLSWPPSPTFLSWECFAYWAN